MNDSSPTVLVVDDERGVADLYAAWLGDQYTTRVAYSGDGALERLDDETDVVLLDRRMPERSGDAVLEAITERDLDCQVAMVTAVEPDFDIVEMGFDEYLHKPVSQDDLRETVAALLDRRRYETAVSELFSLVAKKDALEDQKSESALSASDEYGTLLERIEQLETETGQLVTEMDTGDAARLLGEVDLQSVDASGDTDE